MELDDICKLQERIDEIKRELYESETNGLWLRYLEMVDILNSNVMAERCGDWELYLSSLQNMLPFLAGSGPNNYTKSIYWFLQEMAVLCPDILAEFKKGFFVVRRTDTFWSGTSPDLCIEQTLMTSIKGSTGLTHGRSLTQASRLVWVLSLYRCKNQGNK